MFQISYPTLIFNTNAPWISCTFSKFLHPLLVAIPFNFFLQLLKNESYAEASVESNIDHAGIWAFVARVLQRPSLSDLLNKFDDLNFFVCFYDWHIINFKQESFLESVLKAAFHLSVSHTREYARKSLSPFKCYLWND